jgi:predicted O-methyltransferase YrrM
MNTDSLNRLILLSKKRSKKWVLISFFSSAKLFSIFIKYFFFFIRKLHYIVESLYIFVSGVHTNQLWDERRKPFQKFVEERIKNKSRIKILEVGSWFGLGSTKILLENLHHTSKLFLVDPWETYVNNDEVPSAKNMNIFTIAAIRSTINQVHNHPDKNVTIIKSKFSDLNNIIKESQFDFIYIDGSHYYSEVKNDLKLAKKLIKKGGVLFGDDLDLGVNPALKNIAKKNLNKDLYVFPDGTAFHPGVYMALVEEFPEAVSSSSIFVDNGFWFLRL